MRKTYIVVISIIVLLSIITFSTYAMFTQDINIGEFVNLTASTLPTESNITEYERITIEADSSKTIDLNITNTTSNSLYYGVWYEMVDPSTINSNINIGKLTGSTNATIGQLASNGNITVQICIVNNGTDDIIINVGVGYSSTSSLNLPTGRSVITGEVQPYVNAAEKVIQLAGNCTSWSSGFSGVCATNSYTDNNETKYHEYRYVGANVDNWIEFNGDMYRIIGAFDENSWGVEDNTEYGAYLLKIISADKIYNTPWGLYNDTTNYITYAGYNNNWTGEATAGNEGEVNNIPASANVLLNTYFLNPSGISTYGTCENLSYYVGGNICKTKDCSKIKRYGIQSQELRNYIEDVTWYLYGYPLVGLSKANWYKCERNNYNNVNCSSAYSGKYKGTTIEKIGLMYISDYMYASSYYTSSNTTTPNRFFANQNWLYNGREWTITPQRNDSGRAFGISGSGNVDSMYTYISYGLRPTFYLKSTIKLKTGIGSYDNPYKIE